MGLLVLSDAAETRSRASGWAIHRAAFPFPITVLEAFAQQLGSSRCIQIPAKTRSDCTFVALRALHWVCCGLVGWLDCRVIGLNGVVVVYYRTYCTVTKLTIGSTFAANLLLILGTSRRPPAVVWDRGLERHFHVLLYKNIKYSLIHCSSHHDQQFVMLYWIFISHF